MKGREMPITIRGIIIPADWDEKGRVVTVAVSGQNEQEYLIDKDYKGRELMHYIEEEVEVRGIATEAKDKKMITVQKYILKKALGQEGIP